MPGPRTSASARPRRGSPSLPALVLLLIGCAHGDAPPKSAAAGLPSAVSPPKVDDSASLAPSPSPPLRFRVADAAQTSATRQDGEPKAAGPLALGQTTVTLENKGPRAVSGPVELVLPADTFVARIDGALGGTLREARMPERDGRVFTTGPVSLAPGEKKVLVVLHAALAPQPAAPRTASPDAAPRSVAFLLDTGVARSHQLTRQVEIVTGLARALPKDTAILVGAYDSSIVPLYEGKASGLPQTLGSDVMARGAAGISDLARAMDWATRPRAAAPSPDRIVVVSDGIDGLDDMATAGIARTLKDAGAPSSRVDVLVPRGPSAVGALRALAAAGSSAGSLIALEDDAAVARLIEGGPSRESYVDARERAVALMQSDGANVPEWLRSELSTAGELPRAKSWERIAPLGKRVRALPTVTEQRAQVDPMEDYSERAAPAAEPITVTPAAEPTKPSEKKAVVELKPQIPPETIQQIVRRNFAALRFCYRDALRRDPKAGGSITIRFDIDETGAVPLARAAKSELGPEATTCFVRAFEALSFPASPSGVVTVTYPLQLAKADANGETPPPPLSMKVPVSFAPIAKADPGKAPWAGDAKVVYEALAGGDTALAITTARSTVRSAPRDIASWILLGDTLAAAGDTTGAVRAYGSLVELSPRDAALLRVAGARFAALGPKAANLEAERSLTRALELEPSAVSGVHMLALLLARRGAFESALTLLDVGLSSEAVREKPLRELLRSDLGVVAQAFVAAEPRRATSLRGWLAQVGASLPNEPSLALVVVWDDDAADVDLAVGDRWSSVAEKGTPNLPTGGRLLGETAQPGGPEVFTLERAPKDYPYAPAVRVKHPSGEGVAGALFRSEIDARGALALEVRSFFLNVDGGRLETGTIERSLAR